MKKLYFGIALLALAVAFSGCKKDKEDPENPSEGGETLTSLSIEPASLTMTAGESVRLDAVYAPKGAKVTLKWSSSDEEVATVASNGTVTALNNGEATINLEAGGKKASCKVKVTSWEETINFTDCFIYGYEIDSTNLVYATYKDDEWGDLKVTFADMEFLFFSEGFGYQNDGYLGGTEIGALAEWNTRIMLAAVEDNKDNAKFVADMGNYKIITWTLGAYYVNKDTVHQTIPGALNTADYVANMKKVIEAYNEENSTKLSEYFKKAAADVTGAVVHIYTYETDEEGEGGYYSSYVPDGLFQKGSWVYTTGQENKSSQYLTKLDYSEVAVDYLKNDASHWCGLEVKEEEDGKLTLLSEEVQFMKTINYVYGNDPRAQSVSMEPKRVFLPDMNDPEWTKVRNAVDNFRLSVKYRK